jgi:hypothetical protein
MALRTFAGVARVVEESDLVALIPRQVAHHLARVTTVDGDAAPIDMALPASSWPGTSGPPRWRRIAGCGAKSPLGSRAVTSAAPL